MRATALTTRADLEWWLAKAAGLHWTWVSTYARSAPHWYVVEPRSKGMTHDDYIRAARVIQTYGSPAKFHRATNIYLTDPEREWKYWIMGSIEENNETYGLINRAAAGDTYGDQNAPDTRTAAGPGSAFYDTIASGYDGMWTRPSDLEENHAVAELIRREFGSYAPSTLDVGCGTGLLLDLGVVSKKRYTGLDPSQGMLNQLVRKHPDVQNIYPGRADEVLPALVAQGREYELVVALFAAATYCTPQDWRLMMELSARMLVLMTYEPGHLMPFYDNDQDRGRMLALMDERAVQAADFAVFARTSTQAEIRRSKIGKFDVTMVLK